MRVCLFALWLLAVAVGFSKLTAYEWTPGWEPLALNSSISSKSSEEAVRIGSRLALTMFVHPQCPCSVASLDSLAEFSRRHKGELEVSIYVLAPDGMSVDWVHGSNWKRACAIDSAHIFEDRNGERAKRFGARTSGTVFLTNEAAKILFQGGMTPGRGREGPSDGAEAIERWMTMNEPSLKNCPVFGCPLFEGGEP